MNYICTCIIIIIFYVLRFHDDDRRHSSHHEQQKNVNCIRYKTYNDLLCHSLSRNRILWSIHSEICCYTFSFFAVAKPFFPVVNVMFISNLAISLSHGLSHVGGEWNSQEQRKKQLVFTSGSM